MDGNNNKNILGEINTRGNFIEKSRTAIGGIAEGNRYKKVSYEDNDNSDNQSTSSDNVVSYRSPKNDYETPFTTKFYTYLIIAGVVIVLFIIIILAL